MEPENRPYVDPAREPGDSGTEAWADKTPTTTDSVGRGPLADPVATGGDGVVAGSPADEFIDDAKTGGTPASTEAVPSTRRSAQSAAEPAIRQLDSIMENLASYAAPVLREIAARAAELAAKAGQAAGPMAYRAAEKTGDVGGRLATKGRAVASDLRRDSAVAGSASGTGPREPIEQTPAEEEAGRPPR